MLADWLAPWLLTYLLHSTLLLASVWVITRLWRTLPVRLQESLWRTALLGGVLTASVQLGLGWEPWSGRLAVAPLEAAAPQPASREAPAPVEAPAADTSPAPRVVDAATPPALPPTAASEPAAARPVDPGVWFAAAWLAVVALVLLRARSARRDLRTRLASRVPLQSAHLRTRLDALCRKTGVRRPIRLSQSSRFGSPIALGVLDPEIVVPHRASTDLSAGQLEVMLAHELAHHVRRDPLVFTLTRCVTTALCFQPLNHLARKRLRETSELLSDAWASQVTGRSRELAECLTTVASWSIDQPAAVPAMAAQGSMLERRVERLLDDSTRQRTRGPVSAWALAPLLVVAAFAPVVATGSVPSATPPETHAVPLAAPAAANDTAHALALLDQEVTALESECKTLLDLLAELPHPPDALRQGAARLQARLADLMQQRAALTRGAQELNR